MKPKFNIEDKVTVVIDGKKVKVEIVTITSHNKRTSFSYEVNHRGSLFSFKEPEIKNKNV